MRGRAYYNEIDPKAAAVLRDLIRADLIADGEVDERSIVDVRADDLRGFAQCHFFAGYGGWSLALRLAGWPDDRAVWSGSCPCLPHSSASRGRRVARDLWPAWFRLIDARRPPVVFGEQADEARAWLDDVCDGLEACGYTPWAAVLPAYGVGADHARERFYFVGDAYGEGQSRLPLDAEVARLQRARGESGSLVPAYGLSDRVALQRGFGNAIVPELAAAFIEAWAIAH
jgi:DNA (cytosine-5)-methyltransferase 1